MTREHKGDKGALVDAYRRLQVRVQNAKLRTMACVLDAVAVRQRMQRARAARHKEPYEPEDLTKLIAEARKAFAEPLPATDRGNLDNLKALLERVRAHNDAIAVLCAQVRAAERK